MRVSASIPLATLLLALISATPSAAQDDTKKDKPEGIILAAGDVTGCGNSTAVETAKLIKEQIDDAKKRGVPVKVLALGDLAYGNGTAVQVACFDKVWGAFKSDTLPVVGNHDKDNPLGAKPLLDHFAPELAAVAADLKTGYFSLAWPTAAPSWRIYGLNLYASDKAQQIDRMKKDLEGLAAGTCSMVLTHAPYQSSGRHGHLDPNSKPKKPQPQSSEKSLSRSAELLAEGSVKRVFDTALAGNVSLMLAGHDHHFEQIGEAVAFNTKPKIGERGVRAFIVGTGGTALHSRPVFKDPKKEFGNNYDKKLAMSEGTVLDKHGVLRIELFKGSYSWSFLPIGGPAIRFEVSSAACR